ncbi:MAG: hypothetical protein U9Q06_02410 [Nanoarchaeota archaeon]|nr:hypothetical protein [Nanoarchaeota archaeon]
MKKILCLTIFLILISQITALEILTEKDTFNQGETFLATLQGNILEPIEKADINFYKGHVAQPINFDFVKIQSKYYIYAVLPYAEENYSLKIQDIYFKENNKVQIADIEKFFSINDKLADFNLMPGALITTDNFTLTFYNNLNEDLQITYTLENLSKSETIPLQDSKQIKIVTDNLQETIITTINFSSLNYQYSFPVQIYKFPPSHPQNQTTEENQTSEDNQTIIDPQESTETEKLRFSLSYLKINVSKNKQLTYPFSILNIGNKTAENITLAITSDLAKYVLLSQKEISFLAPNKTFELNFTFEFSKIGEFEGVIFAQSQNSSDEFFIEFTVVEEDIPTTISVPPKLTCAQQGGKKCTICYGTSITSADGECCLGTCELVEEPTERNWTVIAVIGALLLIVVAIILLKLKKPKPTAKDILSKRSKTFSERFETKNKLTKD